MALEHVYEVMKESSVALNEAKQPIRFGLAYDSRCLGEGAWAGVILRNLPWNATSSGILTNFTKCCHEQATHQMYQPQQLIHNVPYRILDLNEPVKIKD